MGTSPAIIMLYHLFVLLPAAFAVPLDIKPLGQGTGNDMYKPIDPEHYTPDEVYKAANKDDCHPVEKLTYVDECIPYVEKTCFTQQKELCKDVYEKNCTAVIDEYEERECFDVTELICQLGENVQYEMVDETYTVQRCTKVSDRIFDTVYDLSITTKDDFQCVDMTTSTAGTRRRLSRTGPASSPSTSTAASTSPGTARELWDARRLQPRSATIPPER